MVGSLTDTHQQLVSLKDAGVAVMPSEHVIGYDVHDPYNDKVGEVDDLIVDVQSGRVRFLVIGRGGLLGIGRVHRLIPVDIVTEVVRDSTKPTVYVTVSEATLEGSPWDDEPDEVTFTDCYAYFGCDPYWSEGHVERDWSASPA